MAKLSQDEALQLARRRLEARQLDEAEAICLAVLESNPAAHAAWRLLGLVDYLSGDLESALERLDEALALAPDQAEYHDNVSAVRKSLGDYEGAVAAARRALALQPRFPEAENNLGNALLAQRKTAEAVAAFQRALAMLPGYADAENNLGIALEWLDRPDEAEAAFRRALAANPAFVAAFNNLATLLHRRGRNAEAERLLLTALRHDPHSAESRKHLAAVYAALGRLDEAEVLARDALALQPELAAAEGLLGTVLLAKGRAEEAEAAVRRGIGIDPRDPTLRTQLANVLERLGRHDEAFAEADTAVGLDPQSAGAWRTVGDALRRLGRSPEATAALRRAHQLDPKDAGIAMDLGRALLAHEPGAAEPLLRRVADTNPNDPQAGLLLAEALLALDRTAEAETLGRKALALSPDLPAAFIAISIALQRQGRWAEAEETLRRWAQLHPDDPKAYYHLGSLLGEQERLGEAEQEYRRVIELDPGFARAANNLGLVLQAQGRLKEAEAEFRRAVAASPHIWPADSNLVFSLLYHDGVTLAEVLEAHRGWSQRHGQAARRRQRTLGNVRDPARPLRLGFVSPDLGLHPVGKLLLAPLASLDRRAFEVHCYSDRRHDDDVARRLKELADAWHEVGHVSSTELAERIAGDRIDILFDLAGHTAYHRLLCFAERPAPIQVAWLGYEATTGLPEMDYIVADDVQIRPGEEAYYTERPLRLAGGYLCYTPPDEAPDIGPPPRLAAGHVTFGSLNNPTKITPRVIETWARILLAAPDARLVLKYRSFRDSLVRERYARAFADQGVDPSRVEMHGKEPYRQLLDTYNHIDVALDPFPYGGTSTTLETLWMAAPLVTLRGQTFAARDAENFLGRLGLGDQIADGLDAYVEKALALAEDVGRAAEIRRTLRQRMAASTLCDGARLARELAASLRAAWRGWCETH